MTIHLNHNGIDVNVCTLKLMTPFCGQMTIGAVTAARLEGRLAGNYLLTDQTVSLCVERDGVITALGTFVGAECRQGEEITTLTAYDAAYCALSGDYVPDTVTPPTTALAVLRDVAGQCGLVLADTTGLTDQPVSGSLAGYSCRDMVGYMAAVLGCNALIDREGKLALRWFASGDSITPDDYYSGGLKLEGEQTLTGVRMRKKVTVTATNEDGITSETEQTTVYSAGTGTGLVIEVENPFATQTIVDAVWAKIGGLGTFRTGSCAYFGGLDAEPGDVLSVTDLQGVTSALPVMGLTLELDGGCKATAEAHGESETALSVGTTGPVSRLLSKIQADIAQFKELTADNFTAAVAKVNQLYADDAWVQRLFARRIASESITVGNVDYTFTRTTPETECKIIALPYYSYSELVTQYGMGTKRPDERMTLMGVGLSMRRGTYTGDAIGLGCSVKDLTTNVSVSAYGEPGMDGQELFVEVDGHDIHPNHDSKVSFSWQSVPEDDPHVGETYYVTIKQYFGYRGDLITDGNVVAYGDVDAKGTIYEGGIPLSQKYAPISAIQNATRIYPSSATSFTVNGNTACTVVFDMSASRAQLPSNAFLAIESVNAQSTNVVVTNYWWNNGESKVYAIYRNLTGSAVTTTAQLAMLAFY